MSVAVIVFLLSFKPGLNLRVSEFPFVVKLRQEITFEILVMPEGSRVYRPAGKFFAGQPPCARRSLFEVVNEYCERQVRRSGAFIAPAEPSRRVEGNMPEVTCVLLAAHVVAHYLHGDGLRRSLA